MERSHLKPIVPDKKFQMEVNYLLYTLRQIVLFFSLDQLKGKLNLNIDHMDQLTMDDLKNHVDNAIGQVSGLYDFFFFFWATNQ